MVVQPAPLFSTSELAYLQSSLGLSPPVRPDGRAPTTFRPLSAETDFLPAANGSARLCFADGTEAIVGVKAEVQKCGARVAVRGNEDDKDGDEEEGEGGVALVPKGRNGDGGPKTISQAPKEELIAEASRTGWVDVSIDIPGQRDDDNTAIFLSQMIHEGLVADGYLEQRLWMNTNWHWKLYIDVRPRYLSNIH